VCNENITAVFPFQQNERRAEIGKIIVFEVTTVLKKSDYEKASAHSDPVFSSYKTYYR
jgi:hypothetical protein